MKFGLIKLKLGKCGSFSTSRNSQNLKHEMAYSNYKDIRHDFGQFEENIRL